MKTELVSYHIGYQTYHYNNAYQIFRQPFDWLEQMLQNMTGFTYPSGYAVIHPNHIIKNIWVGEYNEYNLFQERRALSMEKAIYVDRFEGPIGGMRGWNNVTQQDMEVTFNIAFKDSDLEIFGGFPDNLQLIY